MNEDRNTVARRSFLHGSLAVAALASTGRSLAAESTPARQTGTDVTLREKFFGCIAGCHIGSAMGAPVEGWSYERIEREHGLLDKPLPYSHYGKKDWVRAPGTTEDGVERQKLMITAILEKQDRINAEDLRRAWVDHMNPNGAGLVSEPFEGALLTMARTHIPASDIGKYCDYSGLVSLARSCHPIGLINAGDVRGAMDDIREVGQVYNTANSRGILWAEVTVVAIAAATKPGATVDSVIGAIFDNCDKVDTRFFRPAGIRGELERGLKLTADCRDVRQMRGTFDSVYSGTGLVYAQSYANEIVTKAICVLRMTKGNTWEAMKAGINMGRDTDCLAAVAGGIAGALSGGASIPTGIIKQADHATSVNPHTNSRRTLRENSDGLYQAFKARLARLKTYAQEMDAA
ncbi:MAG: ADP-ribosylglycohydrolase family protein [Planctomycetes bacterium]|nr:ADP-ribosylglycohydrolase family protein [Planctomycetota bacterium]